jgi:hypothetical protein
MMSGISSSYPALSQRCAGWTGKLPASYDRASLGSEMTPANLAGVSAGKGTTSGHLTTRANLSGRSTGSGTTSGDLTVGAVAKVIPIIVSLDDATVDRLLARLERWHLQPSGDLVSLQREMEDEAGTPLWDKLVHILGHPATQGLGTWIAVLLSVLSLVVALRAPSDSAFQSEIEADIAKQAIRNAQEIERESRDEAALKRQRERAKRFAEDRQRFQSEQRSRKRPPR